MKLTENDIGKYFKRRDGERMFLLSAFPDWHAYDFIACSETDAEDFVPVFNDGRHHPDRYDTSYDIIAPWPETKTIKGWVNVYDEVVSVMLPSKEKANLYATSNRRACKYIEITYTEGEGLDD